MASTCIAYFISSHGFGHAARAAAVIQALSGIRSDVAVSIVTDVPKWFFRDCPIAQQYRPATAIDVGMVQSDPLKVDVAATLTTLRTCFPYPDGVIDTLARRLAKSNCCAIITDIAPVGILVARRMGIPGILLENFTWDWIYEAYTQRYAEFADYQAYLASVYAQADVHIKTTPFCRPGPSDLVVPPISRRRRMSSTQVQKALSISPDQRAVMVTLGGIRADHLFTVPKNLPPDMVVIYSGSGSNQMSPAGPVRHLPYRSPLSHPDVVAAVDGVIGKAGYSTIAEVYAAGVPFGYIRRPDFRESPILEKFIDSTMTAMAMDSQVLAPETLGQAAAALCQLPRNNREMPNGADAVARFLIETILPGCGRHRDGQ